MNTLLNNGLKIEVKESHLTVKNNLLYNTETKMLEGVDGDYIEFATHLPCGNKVITRGVVDGYTNGKIIKLRGAVIPYENEGERTINHLYTVENLDAKSIKTDVVFAD